MKLWPAHLIRSSRSGTRPTDPADPAYPAFVLRTSPVLLLAGPPADAMVDRLLHEWNPAATAAAEATPSEASTAATPPKAPEIAEGVRWVGPFRLDGVSSAEAGLPSGWSTAYAAPAARRRTRVPDGLDAGLLRLRYPHGIPAGAEAVAWSRIMGLARRLGGAGRLPADSPRGSRTVSAQRPLAQENSYCVYGNEALSWSVLRSVLCLSLPELDRNGALADDDYCLDRPGAFEVRVQPFRPNGFVPYALRPGATADWPGTVYRFRCLPQQTERSAQRIDTQLRAAACLLADVVGGVLLDGDGFPLAGVEAGARR
jgi:hypothetical protein